MGGVERLRRSLHFPHQNSQSKSTHLETTQLLELEQLQPSWATNVCMLLCTFLFRRVPNHPVCTSASRLSNLKRQVDLSFMLTFSPRSPKQQQSTGSLTINIKSIPRQQDVEVLRLLHFIDRQAPSSHDRVIHCRHCKHRCPQARQLTFRCRAHIDIVVRHTLHRTKRMVRPSGSRGTTNGRVIERRRAYVAGGRSGLAGWGRGVFTSRKHRSEI